jgi:hypothetical protein
VRVACLLLALLLSAVPAAAAPPLPAVVDAAFLELHTGPGRGFPVFHVFDRGQRFEIVARRTDWFRIRSERGDVTGWVSLADMAGASGADGSALPVEPPGTREYLARRFEVAASLGDFGGGDAIGLRVGYRFTTNFSAELYGTDVTGRFSDGWLAGAALVHQPFPEWRLSPFLSLGAGVLNTQPRASLADVRERTDQVASVGAGLRMHLTRRFMLRAEYERHLIITDRNANEEINEWKAGFAFFF